MTPARDSDEPAAWYDRLDARIVLLFLGLLLLIQAISFGFIDQSIEANARRAVVAELGSAERVFQRLLAQRADRLHESARVLAADFGFRDAIASGDAATIGDALANNAQRIGAPLALFADTRLQAVAVNRPAATRLTAQLPRAAAAAGAIASSTASTPPARPDLVEGNRVVIDVVDGRTHLIVAVPVLAPRPIGWLAMSFPLGAGALLELQRLTSVAGTLLVRSGDAAALRLTDTVLPAVDLAALGPALAGGDPVFEATIGPDRHLLSQLRLVDDADTASTLLLARSIDDALAPFRRLKRSLLALTLLGGALFGLGSWLMARRVTRPIKDLSASAGRLGAGDYDTPIPILRNDEVGSLARAFESMRIGIRERDRRITRLAFNDELTGLPNRARFVDVLTPRPGPGAILMLDLDRFKQVNEVLGQAAGDRLLVRVAERLRHDVLGPHDLLARFGGDEFVIWLPGADAGRAGATAEAIGDVLDRPLLLDDQTVDVGAGIGIALCPDHAADAPALIAAAEVAMYEAKRRHARVLSWQPSLDSGSAHSLSLLSEIRTAIQQDQFALHLQPKVALADGRLVGAEALVRWHHPVRGMVAPMQFVPFLEKTGTVHLLTAWVLRQAAFAVRDLAAAGVPLRIAVNLSARDLIDADFPAKVERVIAEAGIARDALCLEITESATMDDPERALATLQRLHQLGLPLSIDDFGTGYSSLSYLKRLPVSQLKIDRSFVMAIESDPADAQIVRSTIELAHALGLSVVAEGLETPSAWDLLRAMGCDEAQGYLIARPLALDAFRAWCRDWRGSAGRTAIDAAANTGATGPRRATPVAATEPPA